MTEALHELASVPNVSVRSLGKKYGIDESLIRWRKKKLDNTETLGKAGRK